MVMVELLSRILETRSGCRIGVLGEFKKPVSLFLDRASLPTLMAIGIMSSSNTPEAENEVD
jgi:hypothetical protein